MTGPFGLQGSEYGPFLYASVGEDRNGMALSVLSTLARRDLDPWKEAAELSAMPIDAAARRLTSLITGLPGAASRMDARGTVPRLILLLPKRADAMAPRIGPGTNDALGTTKSSLVIWIIVAGLIMSAQAVQTMRQPPGQTKPATASTATEGLPNKGPSLGSGQ